MFDYRVVIYCKVTKVDTECHDNGIRGASIARLPQMPRQKSGSTDLNLQFLQETISVFLETYDQV